MILIYFCIINVYYFLNYYVTDTEGGTPVEEVGAWDSEVVEDSEVVDKEVVAEVEEVNLHSGVQFTPPSHSSAGSTTPFPQLVMSKLNAEWVTVVLSALSTNVAVMLLCAAIELDGISFLY